VVNAYPGAHSLGRKFEPLNEVLVQSLRKHGDVPLLHTADELSFTGAEVEREIARYAAALARHQVELGTRLAILSGNRVEVLFVQHAVGVLGGVYITLHPLGTPFDFAHVLKDSFVEVIVVDKAREKDIVRAIELSGSTARVLTLGGEDGRDLVLLARNERDTHITIKDIDPEAICRVIYTGGTTGVPKASEVSYRSLSTMYGIETHDWQWPEEIRHLVCAPLSHVGGACFMPTIARGGSLYIEKGFDVVRILSAIEKHRITCILLVPTMIGAILDHPRLREFDVSSLETIFYGASPISTTRLRAAIAHFGPIFFQFYGQAEAVTTVTTMRREEHDLSSTGAWPPVVGPVPEAAVRLLDPGGNEVPDGEPGELCVRGPLVMSGYFNKPEETASAFRDGMAAHGRCCRPRSGRFPASSSIARRT
jgi:fatty-acyl-CoA synthase